MNIDVYTDGSSRGNPGPGGYGIVLRYREKEKELSGGFRLTTNNRMELMAVIVALESLKTTEHPVVIHSDSKYVIDSITKGWVFGWHKKGFKGKKNADLWMRYLMLHAKFKLTFTWVRGHNGHPENERCDLLATQAALNQPTGIDQGFENELGGEGLF
ncbi:MAG: ribonuclease HI [Bacteroidota bacterium]